MFEVIPNWHPLFVHFTVALFSLSVIFFIIQKAVAETEFGDNLLIFARYALWLGVFFSLFTLAAGWDAYNTVDHDTPSHEAMTDHKNWGFATAGLFFIAAIWWKIVDSINDSASIAFLLCMIVGGGLLVTTGHKGSQLVYQYGLGVQSLPAKDDHKSSGGHSHSHAGGEASGDDHHTESSDNGHAHDAGASSHEHDSGEAHGDKKDAHKAGAAMLSSAPSSAPSSEGMEMDDLSMEPEPMKDQTMAVQEMTKKQNAEPAMQQPKVEKYEDGSTRELLPEVELEKQE